jgi:hypothetical protein
MLAIVTLLVAGLLTGMGDLVQSQQERAVRSQLDTVGNRLAADIGTASRLVDRAGANQMRLRTEIPDTVGGSYYTVDVTNLDGTRYRLELRSSDPEVRTTVEVRSPMPVRGSVSGGRLVIQYDSDSGELVVSDDR